MRALTSASGMPRAELSRIRLGQISDSVNTARSGLQWSRKLAHVLGRIERGVLMHGPRPEPLGGELGGGDRARGQQEGQRRPLLGQRRHQRQDGVGLADAGGMEPGEAARRPLRAGLAQPLAAPRRLLLAVPLAKAEQQRRHRPRQARQRAVGLEAKAGLGRRSPPAARAWRATGRRRPARRPSRWQCSARPRPPAGSPRAPRRSPRAARVTSSPTAKPSPE